jgi:hypothetical protein
MNDLWNRRASGASEPTASGHGDGIKMIPLWSSVLAVVVFAGWMIFMNRPAPAPAPSAATPAHAAAPAAPAPHHHRTPLE